MKNPVVVRFRGMPHAPSVEAAIGRWAARLDEVFADIEGCTVVVEQPSHWHGLGKEFLVTIQLAIADTIGKAHDSGADRAYPDVYIAVANAFREKLRELREYAREPVMGR